MYHQSQQILLVPSKSATVFNTMYHKMNSTKKIIKKTKSKTERDNKLHTSLLLQKVLDVMVLFWCEVHDHKRRMQHLKL